MANSRALPSGGSGRDQIIIAAIAVVLAAPFIANAPELLVALGLVPFLPTLLKPAALYLVAFIGFSFFRLHEAFTFLLPFSLPLLLGSAGTLAFGYAVLRASASAGRYSRWQAPALLLTIAVACIAMTAAEPFTEPTTGQRLLAIALFSIAALAFYTWFRWLEDIDGKPWGLEMRAFAALFIILTLGVPISRELGYAQDYWLASFWKIAVTTLGLAWLLKTRQLFLVAIVVVVASGMLVAGVAIYNGLNGIDLVEGTRVTIGRTIYSTPEQIALNRQDPTSHQIRGSVLGDPNDLALVLLFPLGFAVAAAIKSGMPRLVRWLCIGAVPLICLAIIYTQSRGGALGMLAVLTVMLLDRVKSRVLTLAIICVAAFGLFVGMAISDRRSGGAAEFAQGGLDASAEDRLNAWIAASRMAARYPVTGVGMTNFVSHFYEYTPVWGGQNKAVHSTWFAILAEGGLPGFALFVLMFVKLLISVHRIGARIASSAALRDMEPIRLGILASIVGFGVSSTFLTQHINWPIYVQLGIAVALVRYVETRSESLANQAAGGQDSANGGLGLEPDDSSGFGRK